ncbi:MAG: proline iminopeptidase [Herminiimonas sp.]|nr:proline iminopeptidase [Herminiimonas sp.]
MAPYAAHPNHPASTVPYPPIEPYDSGLIEVDGGHRVYWETCGNPLGKPALFLHGGPGGGCSAGNRRLFDPQRYRIILFDQRGCGRSLPHAGLEANTTAHLIGDIELLRQRFGIERWLVLGGSWGATLALAYAEAHPARVGALVLRGVFTARQAELDWLYRGGASFLFPEAWDRFLAPIPECERSDLIAAYHARLTCGDPLVEAAAAQAWCAWEEELMTLEPQPAAPVSDIAPLRAMARIETHYFMHRAFFEEGQLIGNAHRLHGIPAVIVQGRYDAVTPPATAWDLHRAWPQTDLQMVPDAGHASTEPGNLRRLVMATDRFAGMEW